ncbi:hypothetical protein INS49_009977 [Diaporthe citri]|uniref:uncharacterized protein n=1 Tax=Diaporthe citri TaxID=83186 RepID=UPI001C7FE065|nr:uncharacterized protein INS49_009977 [Diaporthe citri]KAG6361749.1 hypothetical protein INS49_009977 [Diaporthe citri]
MSAHYRSIFNMLYSQTCCLLQESMQKSSKYPDNVQIEYIQAWLLLAHYESLRMNESQAMLTSGRAFRLVQMARLYEMDANEQNFCALKRPNANQDDSFAVSEERRRTFWVSTRLPAPEVNFQNSQPISTDFLSEALTKGVSTTLSPFAECVVLVTLHGRCMAHRRASCKESGKEPRGVWARHERLASAVERRVATLAQIPAAPTVERDPMLFFTRMLAHSAIVYLGTTLLQMPWQAAEHQHSTRGVVLVYEQHASRAALEMARLVKASPSLSRFKAHPFLPNLLGSALAYLNTQTVVSDGQPGAEVLLQLLRDLRDVNSLAFDICSTLDETWH